MELSRPFLRGFAQIIRGYVQLRVDPLTQRVARLEQELADVRKKLAAREDKGVWEAGAIYECHNEVTHGSSFWIAQRDTNAKPGDNSNDWPLVAKRGRDGRDGRDARG